MSIRNVLSFCLIVFFSQMLSAQSMYGDKVKVDVKMNYVYGFEDALAQAKEKDKLIFFNCFADWAIPCHAMNKMVFSDQEFADWMDEHFVNFFMDVTKGYGKVLAQKYKVKTQPQYLVLNSDGDIVHRIVGGSPIPEFKKLLSQSLNPNTSLKGMTAKYDAGDRQVKFLREYFKMLRIAEENAKAKIVLDEIFSSLKEKQWPIKENWYAYVSKMREPTDKYFSYLMENKKEFEKENGVEEVEKAISGVFNRVMFNYAVGNTEYDAAKLLDLYLLMQKSGLSRKNKAFSLYFFAKNRGEHNVSELVKILREQKDIWDANLLRTMDLSLQSMKDFSKEDKHILTTYWQERADSIKTTTANHYITAIRNLNTTTGIKFLELSFEEAMSQAEKENKLIFIDCFTTWCAPCKWMDNNTFRDQVVGDYFNKNFINLKIDMEKGEGVDLRERYKVEAFPTMLMLDASGNVVKRLMGAMDPEKIMDKIMEKG